MGPAEFPEDLLVVDMVVMVVGVVVANQEEMGH
jgi:hypothetical protein